MAKGRIRLLSTIPGPRNLGPIVREFCRKEGVVTSFSDSAIKALKSLMAEDAGNEAIPFGSLARRFGSFCGEMPLPVAHSGHVVAAIGAACEDLPPESPFLSTAHRLGLHKAIAETLHEMSDYGLDPDEYEKIAGIADPLLAAKLRSLAVLEQQATDTLRQLGRSFSREHFRVCMSSSPEKGADLGRVLVVAGGEFSPEAVGFLKWAASQGAQITVAVYRHAVSGDLFRAAKLTSAALGVEPELAGSSNELLTRLFTESSSLKPDLRCSVVSAADPLAEAEWALRGCLDLHEAGMPFEKMALYVRNSDSYAPLIESAAKRLGVPVTMWRRAPLLTNSLARLTQSALEACASRDVRSLMALARTTYLDLDFQTRTSLQAALKAAYSTRSDQWKSLRTWVDSQSELFPWLIQILDWRDGIADNSYALEAWIGKLNELMMNLPCKEGTLGGRERDKRAVYVLQQSLNQIASVRRLHGTRSITLGEFTRFAKGVWAEADVSVPAGETGLLVSSSAESLPELRCLFVLGMLEGVFPRRRTEDPILSDFDREAISDLRGGSPLPSSRDRADKERDEFYAVCAAATDEIVFSYPETDEERDNVPAFYLDEVSRALGGINRITRSRHLLTPEIGDCAALSDQEIAKAMEGEPDALLPTQFSDSSTAQRFARDPEGGLRPRELREALQCPFAFFAQRTLGLRPERLRARWFSLVRLPQAAEMAAQPSPEAAKIALESELDKQLDGLYSEVPDWEIALLRSGGKRLIREWVEREFAARKIWPKENPRAGVMFGEAGLRDTLPKIVKLTGKVAGTARTGPYSVVQLVETSGPAKVFGAANELTDQDKLYYGVHLLAAWDQAGSNAALEIETMSGERVLLLLPRLPGTDLSSRVAEGLRVMDLAGSEDSGGPRRFFNEVKELAREAVERITRVDVRAIRGDHCTWCDYGELCRQSREFGEEDSPFGEDF